MTCSWVTRVTSSSSSPARAVAAIYDLAIDQGAVFRRLFTWTDDGGDPVPLDGYTAKLQLRVRAGDDDTPALALDDTDGITLGGVAGTIDVVVTADRTAALDAGDYVWDLLLIPADPSEAVRLLEGKATVSAAVSR